MKQTLLEIDNLSKRFCRDPRQALRYALQDIASELGGKPVQDKLRPGEFWAVRDVSLYVEQGEVLGVIGHNGAGKSTLINLVSGILRPTLGKVTLHTNRVILMDHQGGLSPVQTGRENIGNQLALYGMDRLGIEECIGEVIGYSELGDFIDAPVGTYSLGMRLRLAFAIYSRLRPDLFIVDEALNGGDLRFRMKFKRFLNDYIDSGGSILLASHDLFTIQTLCRRCVLMDHGKVFSVGDPESIIHSYTELAGEKNVVLEQMDGLAAAALSGDNQRSLPGAEVLDVVEIVSVEVTAPDGGVLTPGGPASVRVVCQSNEAVSSVLCGLEIGVNGVFPVASLLGGYGEPRYNLALGRSEFRCHIDRLPLLPGIHLLTVAIVKKESGVVLGFKGYQDAPVRFEVKGQPDQAMNMAEFRKNLMHIPVRWEKQSVPAAPLEVEKV